MKYTRKITTSLLFMTVILSLCSCQKTPDKKAVVSKSGGISEENILKPIEKGQQKDLDISTYWKETMESDDGRVTLTADLEIELPVISNTPVWEMSGRKLSQQDLERLTQYFAGGQKLYQEPRMTKAEITDALNQMNSGEGRYSDWSISDNDKRDRLEVLLSSAPETKEEKNYITPEFTLPVKSERQETYDMEVVLTEKNTFQARIDTGKTYDPQISATQYDQTAGTTSCFEYQNASVISDLWLMQATQLEAYYAVQTSEMSEKARLSDSERNAQVKDVLSKESTISLDAAKEESEQVLSDLDISGMTLLRVEKAAAKEDTVSSWYQSEEDWSLAKVGYTLTYSTSVEGLAADEYIAGSKNGMPEEVYTSPFLPERIEITLTDDGIMKFSWLNMADKESIVAENTRFQPFEEIKERLLDHLYYGCTSPDPNQNPDKSILSNINTVTGVTLQYVYTSAYDKPNHAWLVPAWIFQVDEAYINYGKTVPIGTERIALNAIDGSFISIGGVGQ